MNSIQNKVVFITGGGHGIGLSLGKVFAGNGAKVVLADIDEQRLNTAKASLADDGLDVETVVCDVAKAESVRQAADFTIERFGNVHVVLNNAGGSLASEAGTLPPERGR